MKPVKKQTTAFLLLLLVILPVFVSVYIVIKQSVLQNRQKERFLTEHLQTVTLPATNVTWIRINKEILIEGRLFDVKSVTLHGSTIVFTGFFDHKEDGLVKQSNKLLKNDRSNNNPTTTQLSVKYLFIPQYKELTGFTIENNWQLVSSGYAVYAERLADLSFPSPAPPPRSC